MYKISYYSQRNPDKVKPIYNVSVGIIWKKNKILIIAGKGHEKIQVIKRIYVMFILLTLT